MKTFMSNPKGTSLQQDMKPNAYGNPGADVGRRRP